MVMGPCGMTSHLYWNFVADWRLKLRFLVWNWWTKQVSWATLSLPLKNLKIQQFLIKHYLRKAEKQHNTAHCHMHWISRLMTNRPTCWPWFRLKTKRRTVCSQCKARARLTICELAISRKALKWKHLSKCEPPSMLSTHENVCACNDGKHVLWLRLKESVGLMVPGSNSKQYVLTLR